MPVKGSDRSHRPDNDETRALGLVASTSDPMSVAVDGFVRGGEDGYGRAEGAA
jgi:hypothetical protein